MNKQNIIIGTCIVGGLIGLGLLGNYFINKNEKLIETDLEHDKKPIRSVPKKEIPKSNKIDDIPIKKQANQSFLIPVEKKKEEPKALKQIEVVTTPIADEFPLRLGSKGKRVERLNVWLMRNYGTVRIITEEFDATTERLLEKYLKMKTLDEATFNQKDMGLSVEKKV